MRRFPRATHLKCLTDVGHVDLPVDAGILERLVEELPGGPDERLPGLVLLVAGLLPDEHGLCTLASLAENGLRSALVEVARGAGGGRLAELGQGRPLRDEWRRGLVEAEAGGACDGVTRRVCSGIATYDYALAAPWPRG